MGAPARTLLQYSVCFIYVRTESRVVIHGSRGHAISTPAESGAAAVAVPHPNVNLCGKTTRMQRDRARGLISTYLCTPQVRKKIIFKTHHCLLRVDDDGAVGRGAGEERVEAEDLARVDLLEHHAVQGLATVQHVRHVLLKGANGKHGVRQEEGCGRSRDDHVELT